MSGKQNVKHQSDTQEANKRVQEMWEARTREWEAMAQNMTQADAATTQGPIDPKDIRFEVGPPMTLEEFNEWKARREKFMKNNF